MIDTDGCLKKQNDCYCYEISQCEKRKYLLESFRIIAGSLGFRAKLLKAANNMFTLLITGDNIHKIPVKIPRKQIVNQTRLRNNYIHQIEIKSIGRGKFCGWNIDKNERFLLGDFTITHNTRLQGGADSASERYIFTQLNKVTRLIYRPEDDGILTYLDDDGQSVEPIYYVPIIPMVLVNGSKGIGTGFSTDIMCYNPAQIIAYIKHKLMGTHAPPTIEPFYKNFKGTIRRVGDAKYLFKGCYTILDDKKIRITELPVGTWTDNYKKFLEHLIEPPASKDKDSAASSAPIVKEYNDMSTDTHVDIVVTMTANIIKTYSEKATEFECNMLEKVLGLYTTQSTTNMNLFDAKEKLVKYSSPEEIVDSYSTTRLEFYVKRKYALMAVLRKELMMLSNRARYITELLEDKIDLRRKTNKQLAELLKERKYDMMDGKEAKEAKDAKDEGEEAEASGQGYKYLLKLPMDSVSEENVQKLLNEKQKKEKELEELSSKTVEQMWMKDLEELEVEYNKFVEMTTYQMKSESESKTVGGGGGGGGAVAVKPKKAKQIKC
jgi:DNA topoisomerase-2